MKSKWLLIPSMVAIAATPFIGLTSCKDKEPDDPEPQPEPEIEYIDVAMTRNDKSYVSETKDFEKNQHYRFYFNNELFKVGTKVRFTLSDSSGFLAYAGSADVYVCVGGVRVRYTKLEGQLSIGFYILSGPDIEVYWDAYQPIENATALTVVDD